MRVHETACLVGASPSLQSLRLDIACAARFDTPVLISGERGAGKRLVARLVHQRRQCRHEGSFVSVPRAAHASLEKALASALNESRASSDPAPDVLEQADHGSVYIENVEELRPHTQELLWQFLEGRASTHAGKWWTDVRVTAGTTEDLNPDRASGLLRDDLFYRLNVVHLTVPPLRARREDIPALADYLLDVMAKLHGKEPPRLSVEVYERMLAYEWPGNVVELKSVLALLCEVPAGQTAFSAHLPPAVLQADLRRSGRLISRTFLSQQIPQPMSKSRPSRCRSRLGQLTQLCFKPLLFGCVPFLTCPKLAQRVIGLRNDFRKLVTT